MSEQVDVGDIRTRYCELIGLAKMRNHPREWSCRQLTAMCEEILSDVHQARAELRKALINASSPDPLSRRARWLLGLLLEPKVDGDRRAVLEFLNHLPRRVIERNPNRMTA